MYAPIVIFAFNRPDALKNTIESLLLNEEAKDTHLYIFVDGARTNKSGEHNKVLAVQEFVKSICGFKRIEYFFSETNKGLGASIISGVTQVLNEYGRAIIVEDDLKVSTNFLSFMNEGLDRYEDIQDVFSICGYSNRVKVPEGYQANSYFCTRSSSWGWATWKNRWMTVDWELTDWNQYKQYRRAFNRWGGSDCWKMLEDWHDCKNHSWAIRFCFSQFMQKKVSLFPILSKVNNNGFDGQGTNCKKWSRFKFDFDTEGNKNFLFPNTTNIEKILYKSAMKYHSIYLRAWSKIMYLIYK